MAGDVVMVTGGSGFLGQHIVKLLHEKGENIREVVVFDVKPFQQILDYEPTKPCRSIVGDLREPSDVTEALKGVDTVIHTAGLVSFGTFPDFKGMEEVNVNGTSNVIQACVENNVSRLVYTSTIDVVIGYDDIINGNEDLAIPEKFLFPGYPDTKYRAECLVRQADGVPLSKGPGSVLSTVVLRPNVMYGEGDPFYVTSGLKSAHQNKGKLPRIGDGSALFQQAYVGNMAWAHLVATTALRREPRTVGGRVYFITDDTPLMNTFEFMNIFLRGRGYGLASYRLPYPLVYAALYVTEAVLWLFSPLHKVNLSTALCSVIYINHTVHFDRQRAEVELGYKPLYGTEEAIELSMEYYKKLDL